MEATSWPTAASSLDLNYVKLSVNYLLCKCVQQFTARSFNTACAQHQLRQLHATLAHLGHDMSSSMRFKMFVALLLVRCMDLMSAGSEAALHAVAQIAFDRNADRALPLDLLGELRAIVLKKISFELEVNFFVKYADHMREILFNFQSVNGAEQTEEEYDNERFYKEMADLIKKRVKPDPSVVYEIASHYEHVTNGELEAELCNVVLARVQAKRTAQTEPRVDESLQAARPSPTAVPDAHVALPVIPVDSSSSPTDVHVAVVDDSQPSTTTQQQSQTPTYAVEDYFDFNFDSDCERGGGNGGRRAPLASIENDATPGRRKTPSKKPSTTPAKRPATPANRRQHRMRIADLSTDHTDSAIDECVFGKKQKPAKHVSDTDDAEVAAVVAEKPARPSDATTSRAASSSAEEATSRASSSTPAKRPANRSDHASDEGVSAQKTSRVSDTAGRSVATTSRRAMQQASGDKENNPQAATTSSDTRTRKRTRKVAFTHEEHLYLVIGVIILGKGNWAKILYYFRDHFHDSRTSVKLKDKYRTLKKKDELEALEVRAAATIRARVG